MAIDRDDMSVEPCQVQVAILAKAPIPGLAKTRLIPALGARGAARLQRTFTRATLRTALDAKIGAVTLWCAPDRHHRFFRALEKTSNVRLLVQPNCDLGERMHVAFRLHCVEAPLILIGTDCPALTSTHLRRAASALVAGDDAVFYPAEDGGYVLVGLRRPQVQLFSRMTWSTPVVMADTRIRARSLGLRVREFEALRDVDVPADLAYLHDFRGEKRP